MPGIAGIIGGNPREQNGAEVRAMIDSMVHEPFYTFGTYAEERLGLWAGWTSFKGTSAEHMPVWNEAKDICLIFSGEHFGDGSGGDGRMREGMSAHWLRLYEKEGPRTFERLNGWFCGVLADLRENRVIVFNDRYGMNRIYFHQNDHGFYFASEAKALLRVLPGTRKFDYQSLGEYFSFGCALQNRTLYSRVSLLPGGSAWAFSPGREVRRETYFDKGVWENQSQLSGAEYYEKLRSTWARILPRYFGGQEPVGLSLTGGLDSRMILACAPHSAGTLPCYTFGGMYRDCADVLVSRRVAKLCQQPHETIPLDRQFLSEFPALAERAVYLTDGTLDVTGSTDLYVHRRVRQIAPVRVTGLYGGEVLRGLVAFKPMSQSLGHLTPELAKSIQAARQTYADELNGNPQSFIAFKQAPWHIYSRLCIERTQVTIRTPYFDNELVALSYQAPPESLSYQPALRLIAESNPSLKGVGTDRAVGVRGLARARHSLQQFTYKAEYAYDYGMPQWLARLDGVFAPLHIERLFLGRHKYYHFRLWYRDHFHDYLKNVLLDPESLQRPYVRAGAVEKMVQAHITGQGNYALELHRLLTAELLQRKLIEQVPQQREEAGGEPRPCLSPVSTTV